MKNLIYAIDFGTSNSLLAAAQPEQIHAPIPLDPNAKDPTVFRSLLFFPSRERCFYGSQAIEEFIHHDMQGRFIRSIKKYLPMKSFVGTLVDGRPMNLEDIIGHFLREMRKRANEHFDADVDRVVLGRPANFSMQSTDNEYAQYRLERAARNAGFNEIEFFPEPVAAAFGYGAELNEPKVVLVADFGGGTSDFTVIHLDRNRVADSKVLSMGGIPIAGDALDGCIMRNEVSPFFGSEIEYKAPFGANVLKMPVQLMEKLCSPPDLALLMERDTLDFLKNVQKWSLKPEDRAKLDRLFTLLQDQQGFPIFEAIEKTKRELSTSDESLFEFDYPDIEIQKPITRKAFEDSTKERVASILSVLDETVQNAGLSPAEIDLVCCTGGTAKVPALSEGLASRFDRNKITQHNHYHSVIEGLCQRAWKKVRE